MALSFLSVRAALATTEVESAVEAPAPPAAPVLSPQRFPALLAGYANQAPAREAATRSLSRLGAQWCGVATEGNTPVYSVGAQAPLTPASSLKLLTGSAVLDALGPDHTFETEVRGAKPTNGRVNGAVQLVGGGDPLLMTAEYSASLQNSTDVHTPLEVLADRVVQQGVRSVPDGVVVDDSAFDDQRGVVTWEPSYVVQGQVGSISAMSVNQGTVNNGGRVVAPDSRAHASRIFTDLLRQRGVEVGNVVAGARPPVGNDELATIQSRPLVDLVGQMLSESDNTTAEILLKDLAAEKSDQPGSTQAGTTAVVEHLRSIGVDTNGLVILDGSGLSKGNRITCTTLQRVLGAAGPDSPLAAGLAKAGETGTLETRMDATVAEGHVAAKTGTLSNVSALSGWARPPGGEPVRFSLLVNGIDPLSAEAAQDSVAVVLAGLPQNAAEAAYAPS